MKKYVSFELELFDMENVEKKALQYDMFFENIFFTKI